MDVQNLEQLYKKDLVDFFRLVLIIKQDVVAIDKEDKNWQIEEFVESLFKEKEEFLTPQKFLKVMISREFKQCFFLQWLEVFSERFRFAISSASFSQLQSTSTLMDAFLLSRSTLIQKSSTDKPSLKLLSTSTTKKEIFDTKAVSDLFQVKELDRSLMVEVKKRFNELLSHKAATAAATTATTITDKTLSEDELQQFFEPILSR
jgi:hypothetical protein